MRYLKTGDIDLDERFSKLTGDIFREFKENITPKNVYAIYNCKADSRSIEFGGISVSSVTLAGHLNGCSRVVLLAATLGAKADVLIRKYSVLDMEKTLIAQKVSAAMIETYIDEIQNEFLQTQELKELFPVTRYSPGYGDFDLVYQKDILNLLDASRIGLSLTDGFMLTPSKSVTAVIGFSKEQKQTLLKCGESFGCAVCEDKKMRL